MHIASGDIVMTIKKHDFEQKSRKLSTSTDRLFSDQTAPHDFCFDAETASVFDDMVDRSVPFYSEIQRMVCEIAKSFAMPNTCLYDVGCATGTTLRILADQVVQDVQLIGIDNSEEMLDKARAKLDEYSMTNRAKFVNANLNEVPVMKNSSVVIMFLTLQFVRPIQREKLIKSVFQGMHKNGCLILVEKVTGSCTMLNRLFIEYYYNHKRQRGYSELEISQKREALENVLIPYHNEENRRLLLDAGFSHIEEFFRWYNFSGVVALK